MAKARVKTKTLKLAGVEQRVYVLFAFTSIAKPNEVMYAALKQRVASGELYMCGCGLSRA